MDIRKIYILIIAVLFGFFVVVQSRSFENVNEFFLRDMQSNIFQKITILKDKNEDLKGEIQELDDTVNQLADRNLALTAIDDEIKKYKKLSGRSSIFGPGVSITIDGRLTTPWAIDLINEFFNSGAQAVSVNAIRIVNNTEGFDTLPQGQMLLNGSILSSPYIFNVIGESSTLIDILELPGGIFNRLKISFPDLVIKADPREIIQMD